MKFRRVTDTLWRLGHTEVLVEKVQPRYWRLILERDGKQYFGKYCSHSRKWAGELYLKLKAEGKLDEHFGDEVEKHEVRRSFHEELRML